MNLIPLAIAGLVVVLLVVLFLVVGGGILLALMGKRKSVPAGKPARAQKLAPTAADSPLVSHIEAARQELMHAKGVEAVNQIAVDMYPTLQPRGPVQTPAPPTPVTP